MRQTLCMVALVFGVVFTYHVKLSDRASRDKTASMYEADELVMSQYQAAIDQSDTDSDEFDPDSDEMLVGVGAN